MKSRTAIILLLVGLALAVGAYFITKTKVIDPPKIDLNTIITDQSFSDVHYATLQVDTFEKIIKNAYTGLVTVDKSSSSMNISLKNTNQLSSDFYNNNDKLLRFKKKDYGFEITQDKSTGTVNASFEIKNNQVVVPNDVLIRIAHNVLNKPTK